MAGRRRDLRAVAVFRAPPRRFCGVCASVFAPDVRGSSELATPRCTPHTPPPPLQFAVLDVLEETELDDVHTIEEQMMELVRLRRATATGYRRSQGHGAVSPVSTLRPARPVHAPLTAPPPKWSTNFYRGFEVAVTFGGAVIEHQHQKGVYESRGFPAVSAWVDEAALFAALNHAAVNEFPGLRFPMMVAGQGAGDAWRWGWRRCPVVGNDVRVLPPFTAHGDPGPGPEVLGTITEVRGPSGAFPCGSVVVGAAGAVGGAAGTVLMAFPHKRVRFVPAEA